MATVRGGHMLHSEHMLAGRRKIKSNSLAGRVSSSSSGRTYIRLLTPDPGHEILTEIIQ